MVVLFSVQKKWVTWNMPNNYKRTPGSRTYRNFSSETLECALNEIRNKRLTYREASDKYSIPMSTLSRKKNKLNLKSYGGQTALTSIEEDVIVETILFAFDWGYPFDREEVKILIKSYLDRAGQKLKNFKNNMPCNDWYTRFLSRYSDRLKPRLSENIKRSRAAVSRTTINEYFDNLELSLENVPPKNIINYDETKTIRVEQKF